MVIDIHTHIFPPLIQQDRSSYFSDPLFRLLYSSKNAKLATAEDMIASMDKDGVELSLALNINWAEGEICKITNDYIMESMAKYPRRIAGFGTVSLNNIVAAVKEIDRCASGGIKGIGEMRLERHLLTTRDARLDILIQALIEKKMTLLLHCSEPVGHSYPGKGDTTPELVFSIVQRYPDLSLVCAHWGGGLPFFALMPEVKKVIANTKFDTAASPLLYSSRIYQHNLEILGPDSIVFGSDYPLVSQARVLREIRNLQLPADIEEAILVQNARRILGIAVD